MSRGCPAGRDCQDCIYSSMCGGCLGSSCVHVKKKDVAKGRKGTCLFCDLNGLQDSCRPKNLQPPLNFELAEPEMLDDAIKFYSKADIPEQPREPAWPMLIPEVSEISPTTARIGVDPQEGDWTNPFLSPVAWDMTGYLFDKVKGAPWVFEPQNCDSNDWRNILGSEKNWIREILLIDRLPDFMAMQTSPSALMVVYLNRLMTYHQNLLTDDDAPYPWIVTHGYPSYIDWPPAWHFNLGIRMLSSLLGYLSAQSEGLMWLDKGALYPDKSRSTTQGLPLPYVRTDDGNRLLWAPEKSSSGSKDMEWPRFPGIIPFIPGADTNQLAWFGKKMLKAGFRTFAVDALNTIAHENFDGLTDAVSTLTGIGANRVLTYGPWPLHIPSKQRPIHGLSYIVSANHMDLTDYPPRFWRVDLSDTNKPSSKWQELPSFKTSNLSSTSSEDWLEICDCDACTNARLLELVPQSIWRWGHLLDAGVNWVLKVQDIPEKSTPNRSTSNSRLWFQGPSYTVYRRDLQYPHETNCRLSKDIIDTLEISGTKIEIKFPDGDTLSANAIRWGWDDRLHRWSIGFPSLE